MREIALRLLGIMFCTVYILASICVFTISPLLYYADKENGSEKTFTEWTKEFYKVIMSDFIGNLKEIF